MWGLQNLHGVLVPLTGKDGVKGLQAPVDPGWQTTLAFFLFTTQLSSHLLTGFLPLRTGFLQAIAGAGIPSHGKFREHSTQLMSPERTELSLTLQVIFLPGAGPVQCHRGGWGSSVCSIPVAGRAPHSCP